MGTAVQQKNPSTIVIDTSVLLNFVKAGRIALLGCIGYQVLLLDQVFVEVTQPGQKAVVQKAVDAGILSFDRVIDIEEVSLFANLRASGRLGAGESAVLAVAITRNFVAGVQDRRACTEGKRRSRGLQFCQTEDLIVDLIRNGQMTLEDADRLLIEWAQRHRFRSRITSFKAFL